MTPRKSFSSFDDDLDQEVLAEMKEESDEYEAAEGPDYDEWDGLEDDEGHLAEEDQFDEGLYNF